LLVAAVVYVASVPGTLFIKPDTCVYMSVARSLARGEGYTYNDGPFGKYPPVFPLALSAVYVTAGQDIRAMQTLVALCGVGALLFVWLLVRARSGGRIALAVVVLTATCTWFQSHSSAYILSGIPYAMFSLGALWLAERAVRAEAFSIWRWLLAATAGLVAIYTHLVGIALIPAVVCAALFARGQSHGARRRVLAACVAGGICIAGALLWVLPNRAVEGTAGYTRHLENVVPQTFGDLLELARLRLIECVSTPLSRSHNQVRWPVALAAVALFLVPGLVKGFRERCSAAEVYACAYLALLLVAGGQGGYERYMVPLVPLLFYYGCLSSSVVGAGVSRWTRHESAERGTRIALFVLALAVVSHGVVNRVRCKRGASAFRADERAEAAREREAWEQLARWVSDDVPVGEPLYVGAGGTLPIAQFFTGRRTIACLGVEPNAPDVLRHLAGSGARFVVLDDREWSVGRLVPALEAFPECFALLHENEHCSLYGVHKGRLDAAVARFPGRPGEPDPP
jgi:hypothetical protein